MERGLSVDQMAPHIPSFVFTGSFGDDFRDRMMTEHIEEIGD